MAELPYLASISQVDPQTRELIRAEERRQMEKIIMIPSESLTPPAVREALGSVFTSVYAEGYPRPAMRHLSANQLGNIDEQLSHHRRYADWRFYKGTEMADLVESLAGRRAAECFATKRYPADKIYANVQPLSGAAANLAVYDAFVEPGDTVMGLDLTEGGHLTHGSRFNVTGKRYRIVSYSSSSSSGKLDYDKIMELAKENTPRMIIAGFTSFPWQPDWEKFQEIADEVGAILLADVAHTAGMVVGGVYPNPIGYADVVSFTTHKTLCGPRGAVILATDPEIADRIDNAVFPGQQGGPHVNKFAAIAVALKLAQSQEFRDLQEQIVRNAACLASALQDEGLTLAYGGTNTHLLLVDLKQLRSETGFTMLGEIASRILDLVGIVCNKNTIPGDSSAADATGIRLGTPWVTQRGMGQPEMKELAGVISKVLRAIQPFSYIGLTGDLSRGKLPISVLQETREQVHQLISRVDPLIDEVSSDREKIEPLHDEWSVLRVAKGRASMLLDEAATAEIDTLATGEHKRTLFFDDQGKLISEAIVSRYEDQEFYVLVPRETSVSIYEWLSGLADGYILFDQQDIFRKVQGPALVENVDQGNLPSPVSKLLSRDLLSCETGTNIAEAAKEEPDVFATHKSYFVGQPLLDLSKDTGNHQQFVWKNKSIESCKRTPLYDRHKQLGARIVPFAGWDMPVWYSSALEEHKAIRNTAGLFDLGHMGVFSVSGRGSTQFLNFATSNYADWLDIGESQYAYLFDPDGVVIDDIMVYRRDRDSYLVVANAVNEAKDWDWLNGVNDGSYLLDRENSSRRPSFAVDLSNLKQERQVIDIALQGPLSHRIIGGLLNADQFASITGLERTHFIEILVDGHQLLIARTGYTGEEQGYEIYAASNDACWLWDRLIDIGQPVGLKPCGLAARDSARTEAGLPLYGHELEGDYGVNPIEAGFGSYVKLHKPFFIGRRQCVADFMQREREIVRFAVNASGSRPIRTGAAVVSKHGAFLGRVTSCANIGEKQLGMALFDKMNVAPGTRISILNPPRRKEADKQSARLCVGDRVAVSVPGEVVERFPESNSSTMPTGE